MTIQVGDYVTWTHVGGGGLIIDMRLQEGTVTAINEQGIATVKPPVKPPAKTSKSVLVAVARLRLPGQKSQITEFVEAVVEANRVS